MTCHMPARWIPATGSQQPASESPPQQKLCIAPHASPAPTSTSCRLQPHNLSTRPGPWQVLFGATGQASPGELVGLMGPSGAGKSTLLDIISGRKSTGHLSGHITCNGHRLDHRFKRLSAYVPQEDVFVPVSCLGSGVWGLGIGVEDLSPAMGTGWTHRSKRLSAYVPQEDVFVPVS